MGKSFFLQEKIEISWRGRASKLEFFYRRIGDIAIEKIVEIFLVLRFIESLMVPASRLAIECVDISSLCLALFLEIGLQFDACFFRQDRDRFLELDFFDLHEEIDRTTSLSTGETVSNIFLRRNDK